MVFSSFIFLWVFLPIITVSYFAVQDRLKNIVLLIGSLIFYAWGEPKYILLMAGSILVNYLIGILMDKYESKKKLLLIFAVVVDLGLLGYYKYFNFFVEILNAGMGNNIALPNVVLPIGISFFTFQMLSYMIDLYRGEYAAQKNIVDLALYISFFSQLIAGPIVKYKDINKQLHGRSSTLETMACGIKRFIYGLGKKVILANTIAECVDLIYALDYVKLTGTYAWIGAAAYTLQIYYDFSGYSDMAIGLGKIFGFQFEENFTYPYMSSSIQEFWRRWHISLGTWFKEYLYFPLGGSQRGTIRTYGNLMIVFFATGLWHGAGFNFIIWGLYHGVLQVVERLKLETFLQKHKVISHIYTMMAVTFGWVLFRSENMIQAGVMVKRMLLPWNYNEIKMLGTIVISCKEVVTIGIGIMGVGCMQHILSRRKILQKIKNSYLEIVYCTAVFILCIAKLAGNTYNPFIYFRF